MSGALVLEDKISEVENELKECGSGGLRVSNIARVVCAGN